MRSDVDFLQMADHKTSLLHSLRNTMQLKLNDAVQKTRYIQY